MALSRTEAQQRADEIAVFQRELDRLQHEQVLQLSEPQQQQVSSHHQQLLAIYRRQFDIDADHQSRQLSLGMRIASLFGALALAASVLFLFNQFWDLFSEPLQCTILIASSLGSFLLTVLVRRHDDTGYFSKMAAMLALSCLVLNTLLLGEMFNLTPSAHVLLAWAAYALLLAYYVDTRLLLGCGLALLMAYFSTRVSTWLDLYWLDGFEHPEHVLPAALLIFALPSWVSQQRYQGFASIYRLLGMLGLLIPVWLLSVWGQSSDLPWSTHSIEGFYRVVGFALSALLASLGVRRNWPVVINTSVIFFILFLFTQFFDWWWELLPAYLFFFLISLIAIAVLLVLRRLRGFQSRGQRP